MNMSHKVFLANSVKMFTGVANGEEALRRLELMEEGIEDVIAEIHWRFSETPTWEEHIDELTSLLSIVKAKIYAKRNPEKIYLAFCLIECESKRIVVDERIKDLMPTMSLGFWGS